MNYYSLWQLEKHGDILPLPNLMIEEPGEMEAERFAEYMNMGAARQLHESE